MWLAEGSSSTTAIVAAIITAAATIAAAVSTSIWLFRGSVRNAEAERENHWDERVDAELEHRRRQVEQLEGRNAALEQAVDELQTKLLRARWVLVKHRLDPTELDG